MQHDELAALRTQYTRGNPRRWRRFLPSPAAVVMGCRIMALAAIVLSAPGFVAAVRAETEPGQVLRAYLGARMQGDLRAAEALWEPRALRLATALGLQFTDIEASYDDYWMLTARQRQARAAQMRAVIRDSMVASQGVHFTVVLESRTGEAAADTLSYFVKNGGEGWRVTLPVLDLTSNWTRREGRFVRVRTKRIVNFSQHALTAADQEIARLFEELEAPQSAVLRLERIKLDYFLCEDADDVRQLVGSLGHEGYLPAAGRIVSRNFIDLSDVVPLLVQLTLRKLPLHNEPIFEEGLPLALGGTSTASAAVLLQRARNANWDGKRLRRAFEAGTVRDEGLPLEALWNRILLRQLGAAAYLDLVKASGAGRMGEERGDNRRVLPRIEEALGKKGDALWAWATEQLRGIESTVQPGCESWPPDVHGLEAILLWRDAEEHWSLQGYVVGDRYVFAMGPYVPGPPQWMKARVDSLAMAYDKEKPEWGEVPEIERPQGDPPPVYFLVRAKLEEDLEPFESKLFREHFLTSNYRNDLWGFFVTPDDVKLYGYTQNKLLAEYVVAESPDPTQPYYEEAPGHICFSVPMSYLPRLLTTYYVQLGVYTGE